VAVSLVLAAGVAVVWVRSYKHSEAAYLYRGDWYLQTVSHRGRVMTFWIDELPPPKDQPPRGYAADASDEIGKWVKGGTRFYLRDGTRSALGPVKFAKGVADVEAELPPSRARQAETAPGGPAGSQPAATRPTPRLATRPSTVPTQMDVRLTERDLGKVLAELGKPIAAAEPQSAFTLAPPPAPSSARESASGFESPPLTLAPSLKPAKPQRDDSRPILGAMGMGGGAVGRALGGGGAPNISFGTVSAGLGWPTFNYQAVYLPHWLVLGVVSLPAAVATAGLLRRRVLHVWRRFSELCVECGYDLRGSAGTACPECGAAIPERFAAKTGAGAESTPAHVR
jgi:hypothetical protein